jgi:hypothetical protein
MTPRSKYLRSQRRVSLVVFAARLEFALVYVRAVHDRSARDDRAVEKTVPAQGLAAPTNLVAQSPKATLPEKSERRVKAEIADHKKER